MPGLEQAPGPLGAEHVVEGVVERPQVRVDLGHEVAGQEAEPLARLDRRAGQDDAVDLLGLEGLHGQGDGQVALARAGRPDPEGDDVVADGVGVALLAARLGPDRTAPGRAQHLGGEHLGRTLVGPDHVDGAVHDLRVDGVALLEQQAQLVDQSRSASAASSPSMVNSLPRAMMRAPGKASSTSRRFSFERANEAGHQMVGDGDGARCRHGTSVDHGTAAHPGPLVHEEPTLPSRTVDGEDFDALIAAMGAWAADQRAEEAAEGRSRTGWLRRQAAEAATLSGVLVDLAERAAPVTLETLSGPYDGQVEVVTTGLCGLRRPEGGVTLVALPAVTALRGPDRLATGDRTPALDAGHGRRPVGPVSRPDHGDRRPAGRNPGGRPRGDGRHRAGLPQQ